MVASTVWVAAQETKPPGVPDSQRQYPTSEPSQQQPTVPPPPDTSQTAAAPAPSDRAKSVEGCIGGASGSYTLTDSAGKTWKLTGNTSKLGDHVGHMVEASGTVDAQGAFKVRRLKMIAGNCPAK